MSDMTRYKNFVVWIENVEDNDKVFVITDDKGRELTDSPDAYQTRAEAIRKAKAWIDAHSVEAETPLGPQPAPDDYRIANRPGNPNWKGVKDWFDKAAQS